ncbi:MAG: DNA translocase FtsK 4TM domain-containing protein [Bacteroidales bacterium]
MEKQKIIRFIAGVFFSLVAVFTLVTLISYLFTWNKDQSLLSDPYMMSVSSDAVNGGGKIGFLWANFLVSKLFGLGAFIIPFFFGIVSIACFKIKQFHLLRVFIYSLFGCIISSVIFSYIFSFTTNLTELFGQGAGGSYGHYANVWLSDMLGVFGAGCVLLFLLIILLVLMDNRVIDWFQKLFDKIFAVRKKVDTTEATENDAESVSEESEERDSSSSNETDDISDENQAISTKEKIEDNSSINDFDIEFEVENINNPAPDNSASEVDKDESDKIVDIDLSANSDDSTHTDEDPDLEVLEQTDDNDYISDLSDEKWTERYDPRLSLSHFKFPKLQLLEDYKDKWFTVSRDELEKNKTKIVTTLRNYKINISKISARIGPTVTLYEIVPAPGVRVAQIKRLEDDIAISLAARGVRVVTLVGTNAIGIEVANDKPSVVSMKSVLSDPKFRDSKFALPIAIGKTISNEVYTFDLAKMPHLLIAGATGQGKSVGLNAIITSLLYKKHPSELKFVLVDPKKVELSLYEPIEKYYLAKLPDSDDAIITDTDKVVNTLKSLCKLMDHRYDLLKLASVRNVKEYNEKFLSRRLNPLKGHVFMPYIVVIVDEFADLIMTAGRDVEEPITRLAQLARAVGIHLIIATQRPTTNIITGTIKANFPARIAFKVTSSVDSKTILDQTGAKQLIGRGDMLISTGASELVRLQCAFVDTKEVERITRYISKQQNFGTAFLLPEYHPEDKSASGKNGGFTQERDELFGEAARMVVRNQVGSTSMLQRKMNLGYNRAGRIMDQLEEVGIVGPSQGSKAREVRITSSDDLEQILLDLE